MPYEYSKYADGIIQRYGLKLKSGKEYGNKPCPNCGGNDRFYINEFNGYLNHHCRKECNYAERCKALERDGVLPEFNRETGNPYHIQKQIPLKGNARLDGQNVIIPLSDVLTGEEKGHQIIYPDGFKKFPKGMSKANLGCFIGEASNVLFVCEGWATAVAVHVATKQQTLFALDAKTLVKTAKVINHPNVKIAADNDPDGIAAAQATNLTWSKPKTENYDWWDVYHYEGKQALIDQIRDYHEPFRSDNPLDGISLINGIELTNKEFQELEWLKDGFFPIPNFVLIAGAPKVGKSWFALKTAEELAANGHKVVYLSCEDTDRRLKDRYSKVTDFPSEKLIFISGLSSEKPIPKGEDGLAFIKSLTDRIPDLKCVIIDTIQCIRDTNLKQDYASVEVEFSAIRKLAHELNVTIIAVHHTKKKTDFEISPLDKILGSQAIAATVETIIVLERVTGSQDINLFITGKDVEQNDEYRLNWTENGFSDPEDKRIADRGPVQKKIINYVKEHPRCTQTVICDALEKSKQQVNEAVNLLLEKGILKTTEGGRLICLLT